MSTLEHAIQAVKQSHFEIRHEEIEYFETLGEGAMAVVYKAKLRGKLCAAKKLKPGTTVETQEYNNLVMELDVLATLPHHPNLVQFLGAYIEDRDNLVILEELMEGTSLEAFLSSHPQGFDLGRRRMHGWSLDIMRALNHLHNREPCIMHRDLKPDNILLTADLQTLKLADFGTSKRIPADQRWQIWRTHSTVGTIRYMAPEILNHTRAYSEKADIYSASLVIWYMLVGIKSEVDIRSDPHGRPSIALASRRWPDMAKLLSQMWDHRPDERPTAQRCIEYLEALPPADIDAAENKSPVTPNGRSSPWFSSSNLLAAPKAAAAGGGGGDGAPERRLLDLRRLYRLVRSRILQPQVAD